MPVQKNQAQSIEFDLGFLLLYASSAIRICYVSVLKLQHERRHMHEERDKEKQNRYQKIHRRQRYQGRPHVIRLLIGPAHQKMNGKLYKVTAEYAICFSSPENIDDRRNQRKKRYAQIGQPWFFVAYRRKGEAVVQTADADGRENRQDNGAENRLKRNEQQRRLTDSHFNHRKAFQHIRDIEAEKR